MAQSTYLRIYGTQTLSPNASEVALAPTTNGVIGMNCDVVLDNTGAADAFLVRQGQTKGVRIPAGEKVTLNFLESADGTATAGHYIYAASATTVEATFLAQPQRA